MPHYLYCYDAHTRGVGRWFGEGGFYRSIGKGSMISVYKIEPSYTVTIRKHRGHQPPEPPWFLRLCTPCNNIYNVFVTIASLMLLLKIPKKFPSNRGSVFALATDEELEESLREWRERIDGGTADQFMEEYEGRRRKIGLTTSVVAHK